MTLGVVLFVAAMGLTYHNDQTLADRTLATKVDLPKPVRIQDFERSANSNLLGELKVLAEVEMSQSELHTFRTEGKPETYLLLPVFPVSAGAEARARGVVHPNAPSSHRPVMRQDRQVHTPIAVLAYDMTDTFARPTSLETLGLTRLGRGFAGDLVVIAGVPFSRSLLSEGATQGEIEMAARDAFGFSNEGELPLIAPNILHRTTLGPVDMTPARNVLASIASIAFLFALSLVFRGISNRPKARKSGSARRENQAVSRHSATFFDPLMAQDEIQKAEKEERVVSELSFTGLSRRLDPMLARIKSRR